jgi:hypothetical protein
MFTIAYTARAIFAEFEKMSRKEKSQFGGQHLQG